MNKTKAFAYLRKSTDEKDRQILSLSSQLEIVKDIAQKHNFTLSPEDIYQESRSAKDAGNRPEFAKMVKRIQAEGVNTLLCWKANRLARNMTDGGPIADLIKDSKLTIYSQLKTYGREDFRDLTAEFTDGTLYSMRLSDDVKVGLNRKLDVGIPPILAPIGYINRSEMPKGLKEIDVDTKRWHLVKDFWNHLLSGKTVEESLQLVNAKGLTTKSVRPLSRTQAYKIVKNPFYYGAYRYRGEIRNNGKHKPMISYSEWLKVQDLVGSRTKSGEKVKREFYFSGLIRCGECERMIIGETKVKTRKDGTRKIFNYARCSKKLRKDHEPCNQKFLNAIELDKQVQGFINDLELDPDFIDWLRVVLKKQNHEAASKEKTRLANLKRQLDLILEEKNKLWDKHKDGLLNDEQYESEKRRLLHNESIIKDEIQIDGTKDWQTKLENTLNFTKKLQSAFDNGDNKLKKLILSTLGSHFILKDKKVQFIAKNAFILLKSWQNSETAWLSPLNELSHQPKETTFDSGLSSGAGEGSRTPFISLES